MADFQPAVPYFSPLPSFVQADFLRLFDRLLPDHYLAPMRPTSDTTPNQTLGPGYEYLQAVALMMARVSEAVAHVGTGSYLGSATGGSRATSTVEFYRHNAIFGAVTLLRGTLVATSDGYLYQTLEDVVFDASDLGPISTPVEAAARGWTFNKPGPVTTAAGVELPGSINTLVRPVVPFGAANNFDPTLQVRQTVDATGGSAQMLDGIGLDRGIARSVTYGVASFSRSTAGAGAVTLKAGTRLATGSGYLYQTLEDAVFGADTLEVRVPFIPLLSPDAYATSGDVTSIELPYWTAAGSDSTIAVAQLTAYSKESDDAYRARLAFLPQVVTPNALREFIGLVIGAAIAAAGKTYDLREVWDIRFQTAYDFPMDLTLTQAEVNVAVPAYSGNIFVYDYEPADPLSNRYLYPSQGMVVFALPQIPGWQTLYTGLTENLQAAKPAGMSLAYVLTP